MAGLLLAAILSDTVILKSPTTTDLDKDMSRWLSSRAGVDISQFGEEMFSAGSTIEGLNPEQIINQDVKIYNQGELRISMSQIEIVGFKTFYEIKNMLLEKLEIFMNLKGLHFSCLMVTDITKETSLLLCTGERKIIEAITYPRVDEKTFEMKDVLSRKKKILPFLIDLISGL